MDKFEIFFGRWVVRNRWWLIGITIIFLAAAASGGRFLTFNNDSRAFFSEENPQLQAYEALENIYTEDQNVFFIIAPHDGNVFTRKTLTAIEELTEASWQMPYSSRVDSLTNFQHTRAEEDDLIVEDLVQDVNNLTESDIKRIRKIALSEPILLNRLLSSSGQVTGVNVNILMPKDSMVIVPQIAAFARQLKKDFLKKYPDMDIYLNGGVIIDNAFGEVSQGDMTTLIPLMFVVLVVITGVALRSFVGLFTTLLIIAFSSATGMGLAGWLGISLTAASVNAPTIILTLAVADSVHLLATTFLYIRRGLTKHEAIAESLRINLVPVFLTSLTTAVGFLTMNFSDAPPFRDLGNIVAMGVTAAFIYSVFFLPALLAVLPVRIKAQPDSAGSAPCDSLASFVIRRRKPLLWGTLVVFLVMAGGITRIELNDNFIKYFSKRFPIRQSFDFLQENLSGGDAIEYSLEAGSSDGINDPGYLAKVEAFANWFRKQPHVVHVSTITDTIKRLNKSMHGDDEAYYSIPESRELAAQYLLLYELSLPFGLDLNNQINVDKSATRMTVLLKHTSTKDLLNLDERARRWLRDNAPESMFTYGTGISIMWSHITERNIKNMLGGAFGALLVISAILIFALRSLKLGLLSLIPNLMPAIMAFGLWGFFIGRVGMGLSVVASLTLGIVVDDTVHFLSKYLRARREHDMNSFRAVRYAFNTVGTAMWVTTLALVAGFLVLVFSGFRMNSDMGILTAITITLALAMDFLLLPTLLIMVEGKTDETTDGDLELVTVPVAAGGDGGIS